MDPRRNPYAPSAGAPPRELAGRDSIIEMGDIALDRTLAARHANDMMLLGLRGVGKTVLLNKLHGMAVDKGFETIKFEAPENGSLIDLLAPPIFRIIRNLRVKADVEHKLRRAATALRNMASVFKVRVGDFEFSVSQDHIADTGNIISDLPELMVSVAEAAAARSSAIAVFIDEIQYLKKQELEALVQSCHQVSQGGLPLIVIGAGLPQLAALAGNAKSYAERLFTYPEVGALDPVSSARAIQLPAKQEGVDFSKDSISAIIDATQGYPYYLQIWGSYCWDAASTSPIDMTAVNTATPLIIEFLDQNFFKTRLDRTTPLQKKYLRAMAELGPGPHKTGDIAAVLKCEPPIVATTRAQLINLGMIWSMRFGETAFTVPLFDQFMKRAVPELEPHVPKSRKPKGN